MQCRQDLKGSRDHRVHKHEFAGHHQRPDALYVLVEGDAGDREQHVHAHHRRDEFAPLLPGALRQRACAKAERPHQHQPNDAWADARWGWRWSLTLTYEHAQAVDGSHCSGRQKVHMQDAAQSAAGGCRWLRSCC